MSQPITEEPPRLLHVYHGPMTHNTTQIRAPDKVTTLYTIKTNPTRLLHPSSPHLTIYRADTATVIGTVRFHSLSHAIDTVIHDHPLDLARSGFFITAREWTSRAAGNAMRFRWKHEGVFLASDMKCLDGNGQVCARFERSALAMTKDGKFEVGRGVSGGLLDEVVVTGVAMLELRRRNAKAAAGARGGAGLV